MGLDMYLYKMKNDCKEDIHYWRKANQIRRYFVECANNNGFELDNCEYTISKCDIINLQCIISEVLKDKSKAEKLLPVQQGFFFGRYEYDEYYFKQLEETLAQIPKWLDYIDNGYDIIYYEWY